MKKFLVFLKQNRPPQDCKEQMASDERNNVLRHISLVGVVRVYDSEILGVKDCKNGYLSISSFQEVLLVDVPVNLLTPLTSKNKLSPGPDGQTPKLELPSSIQISTTNQNLQVGTSRFKYRVPRSQPLIGCAFFFLSLSQIITPTNSS